MGSTYMIEETDESDQFSMASGAPRQRCMSFDARRARRSIAGNNKIFNVLIIRYGTLRAAITFALENIDHRHFGHGGVAERTR